MGNKDNMRIFISVSADYAALFQELASTPPRDRASRLRFLASSGLNGRSSPITFASKSTLPVVDKKKEQTLKVIVLLARKDYAELFDELSLLPMRDRTARFRLLAQHGLVALLQSSSVGDKQPTNITKCDNKEDLPPSQGQTPPTQKDNAKKKRMENMLAGLNGDLKG